MKKITKKTSVVAYLSFGEAMGIKSMLPGFKTPTYADHQVIDGLLKKLDDCGAVEHNQKLFSEFNLSPDEVVTTDHPVYYKITQAMLSGLSTLTKSDLSVFTQKHFNALTDGYSLNYSERSLLQNWLVTEEK